MVGGLEDAINRIGAKGGALVIVEAIQFLRDRNFDLIRTAAARVHRAKATAGKYDAIHAMFPWRRVTWASLWLPPLRSAAAPGGSPGCGGIAFKW